jgi:hypothetical protein
MLRVARNARQMTLIGETRGRRGCCKAGALLDQLCGESDAAVADEVAWRQAADDIEIANDLEAGQPRRSGEMFEVEVGVRIAFDDVLIDGETPSLPGTVAWIGTHNAVAVADDQLAERKGSVYQKLFAFLS